MSLRLNALGRLVLLAGAAALVAGLVYSWPAAILAGWAILLALMSQGAVLARRVPPQVRFEVPAAVRAGGPTLLPVAGHAHAFRSLDGPWLALPGELILHWEEPGVRELPSLVARWQDACGWWQRTAVGGGGPVTVLPSQAELARASAQARMVAGVLRGSTRFGALDDLSDPEGLRTWTEGTNSRFIDWKASSRFEGLLEKQFTRVRELDLEVVLDATTAARRRESSSARAPLEVALPTVLHILEWGRSQGRKTRLVVVGDAGAPAEIDATGRDPSGELRKLVGALPLLLPSDPAVPAEEGASAFESVLRRMRARSANPALVRALQTAKQGSGVTALFVVTPLELAADRVRALGQAGANRNHRILVQVGELQGAASDAAELSSLYPRAVRRRRNSAILAGMGWITVDAHLPQSRPQVLRSIATKVEK